MNHADLAIKAREAGLRAGHAITPTPMHVQGYAPVMDGLCGFAWIIIKPANSAFAKWLKAQGLARNAYGGGVQVWVSDFNQSMERKRAYAFAYAEVLRAEGIRAYADSRLD